MNILLNCLSAISGGSLTYLRNLVPGLHERLNSSDQHNLTILVHRNQLSLIPTVPEKECVVITEARPSGIRGAVWGERIVNRVCQEHESDVLFQPYQVGRPLGHIKRVLMLRNMEPFLFQGYKYSASNWARNLALKSVSTSSIQSADRVIAVSNFVEKYLFSALGVPQSRIRKIYHGRDVSFRPGGDETAGHKALRRLGVPNDYIFTCGSILPYRRLEDVLQGFELLLSRRQYGIDLVIAGGGNDRRYHRKILNKIDLSAYKSRIHYLGNVSVEDMRILFRCCRMFVSATEIEACPNIVIEALSSGCTIVASASAPLPEILSDAAVFFEPRNAEILTDMIEDLLIDADKCSWLALRALNRAQDFSWDKCITETYLALVDW